MPMGPESWLNNEDQEATLNFLANISGHLPDIQVMVIGYVTKEGGMTFHLAGPAWALIGVNESLGECIRQCSGTQEIDLDEED